jgi:hypothetical protein
MLKVTFVGGSSGKNSQAWLLWITLELFRSLLAKHFLRKQTVLKDKMKDEDESRMGKYIF